MTSAGHSFAARSCLAVICFQAGEAEVRAELEALAAKKHVGVLPGEHLSFHHVLSASRMKHLQIPRSLYAGSAGARLDEKDIRGVLCGLRSQSDEAPRPPRQILKD